MLPDTSALALSSVVKDGKTKTRPASDVGVFPAWLADGALDLLSDAANDPASAARAARAALERASDWWRGRACESAEGPDGGYVSEATSELWRAKQLEINNHLKTWDHCTRPQQVTDFMRNAKDSPYDTLAHVVLMKKRFSDKGGYPSSCKLGDRNFCYHGHLLVVFEPIFRVQNTPQRVVSIGYFPEGSDKEQALNIIPMFNSAGMVTSPDGMLQDAIRSGKWEDIVVLHTFVVSPERMLGWFNVTSRSLHELTTNRARRTAGPFKIQSGRFGFYSGVPFYGPAAYSIFEAVDAISELASLSDLFDATAAAMRSRDFAPSSRAVEFPVNCARWVQLAFPEADLVCPLGVPRFCVSSGAQVLPALADMAKLMTVGALAFAQLAVAQVMNEKEREELTRMLRNTDDRLLLQMAPNLAESAERLPPPPRGLRPSLPPACR